MLLEIKANNLCDFFAFYLQRETSFLEEADKSEIIKLSE